MRSLIYDWCLYNGSFDLRTAARERFSLLIELFTAKTQLIKIEQKKLQLL
jgi:hypothetical protein